MLDTPDSTEKAKFYALLITAAGSIVIGITKVWTWFFRLNREHHQMMEYMHSTKPHHDAFPIIQKDVEVLKEHHEGIVDEVRLLRQELQDFLKYLIKKNGD